MKRILAVILLLCAISPAYGLPRLSVRAFEDRTPDNDAPASAVMDMMVTELDKAGIFSLLERERLDLIAAEQKLNIEGLVDPDSAIKVGKLKGAQYMMTGAITLYYYDEKGKGIALPVLGSASTARTAYVMLEIRIFDNSTGEIVYTSDQLGTAKREAKGAIAAYRGFFIGKYARTTGGILASATRDAVMKHVSAMKMQNWE